MSSSHSSLPVVILAYQRPDKLRQRFAEIISWPKLNKLIISVDAPRLNADKYEISRVLEVLMVSRELQKFSNAVDVQVQNENRGVNNLIYNIFDKNKSVEGIILIEDDVSVSHQSLDFLLLNYNYNGAEAASAHVMKNHVELPSNMSRISIFPNQWGVAFSSRVMNQYLEIYKSKKFERNKIQKVFKNHFADHLRFFEIEKLTQWWFNHFYFCFLHGNWADALLQYSVYSSGSFYRAPAKSLIKDDNLVQDSRSMNPRIGKVEMESCYSEWRIVNSEEYRCIKCELESSHIFEAKLLTLIASTKHRKVTSLKSKLSN